MVIKKSKKKIKESTLVNTSETFPEGTTKSKERNRKIIISYPARFPVLLYDGIKDYLDKHGRHHESINEILMAGGFVELQKRLSKVGENIDRKIKINCIIDGIQSLLKELEDLK